MMLIFRRFKQMALLGEKILARQPDNKDVKKMLDNLADSQKTIWKLWEKKHKDLQDAKELQVCMFLYVYPLQKSVKICRYNTILEMNLNVMRFITFWLLHIQWNFTQVYLTILFLLLQAFLREADQIDSATASHEAFLDFEDLGVSIQVTVYL